MATIAERMIPFPDYMLINTQDHYRFWSKVDCINKTKDECWNWTGAINVGGYGTFLLYGEGYVSHRVSYFLEYRKDPGKLLVCHQCNNRKCVNPNHLYLGDHFDNNQQACDEGRKQSYGEFNPRARVTEKEVLEIIALTHTLNLKELSQKYAIGITGIAKIIANTSWKHLSREKIKKPRIQRSRSHYYEH